MAYTLMRGIGRLLDGENLQIAHSSGQRGVRMTDLSFHRCYTIVWRLLMFSTRYKWKRVSSVRLIAGCALIVLFPGGINAQPEEPEDDSDPQESIESRKEVTNVCGKTTLKLWQACKLETHDAAAVEAAQCLNLSDPQASKDCEQARRITRAEALVQCAAVSKARDEVCTKLGAGPYDPIIDPANFVVGINNPHTPFAPGAFRVYEKKTATGGVERIRVEVLPETRVIMGVTVITLRDVVTRDGVLIEDTKDWLAQDKQGNVWYFGEIVQNFEDGLLANLSGSFEAGKEKAKAGLWMKGNPKVGDYYRQEWSLNNAEDIVEVVSLDALDTNVPFSQNGTGPILKTLNITPLSPGVVEYKYYVPGIGFALELKSTGERLELVDYGPR